MSKEFLDDFFPDRDNNPSNYALIRTPDSDILGYYGLCYKPEMDNTTLILELKEDLDKLFQVFEYLLANGVEIIEPEDCGRDPIDREF